jgi:hypothetical protein
MGREYQVTADGGDLAMTAVGSGSSTGRFVREAPDRWRGVSGDNDGEVLAVLRDEAGEVTGLDIATFVFSRDHTHLA